MDGFLPSAGVGPHGPVTARPCGRTWTRVARPRARADAALGLNSWGLKQCIILHFFPTGSLGFWLGVHYRREGEVLLFCRIFRSCWFEDVGPRGYLGGSEGEINFKG
jgi:hypothetical protein